MRPNTPNALKSPLRYPGGKTRAVPFLSKLILDSDKRIVSPFFGGGSFELHCSSRGLEVIGYDVFSPLVDFWQSLLSNPKELASLVSKYLPLSKPSFYSLQKEYQGLQSQLDRAAAFYVLNRSSFSGATSSGGMSPGHPRFNQASIDRISDFKPINTISVNELSFETAIPLHSDSLFYLDPPYHIESSLYGHKGSTHKNFDHLALAAMLKDTPNWILSYNDCPFIRDLYAEFTILKPEWAYGMSSSKASNEILILSDAVKDRKSLIGLD